MCKTDAFLYCENCNSPRHFEYLPLNNHDKSPYVCRGCKIRHGIKPKLKAGIKNISKSKNDR